MQAPEVPNESTAKALGAFYTDAQIAEFLVWWAVRERTATVLDPSFGGGAFLRAACQRLEALGGTPREQVFGVELDPNVHDAITSKLSQEFALPGRHLLQEDFFALDHATPSPVDVIVGNPPFIRYQRFIGDARDRAQRQVARVGLSLSALTSSWLPFLVHSITQLKTGGRLAMVLPFELTHAAYARPGLEFLQRSFGAVQLLTFRQKLFPELSEDTLLLLAEDKGQRSRSWRWRDLAHAGELADLIRTDHRELPRARTLDAVRLVSGDDRLIDHLIPKKAQDLYRELASSRRTTRLGELADVGIGYVTGANDFFHLSPEDAAEWKIPTEFLREAVRRGRSLRGLFFTANDWARASKHGEASYLLHIKATDDVPTAVERYLATGKAIRSGFKVRSRKPWYTVPHVYQPDAFLSYMSGTTPRLVSNDAHVVAPNSLHILRLHDGVMLHQRALATLWQTSLTRLSVELEGHALGGGMLKLEPTEAEHVVLPWPTNQEGLTETAKELDAMARSQGERATADAADQHILRGRLNLSAKDIALLQDAATRLQERRLARA
jgi:adenine-specific DNA-methyltransferase